MKELSIEEKAKAYDGLFVKAKQIYNKENDVLILHTVEYLLPELKESEDEQHRKWILEYLYDGLRKSDEQFKGHFKTAIDWLEKQGEQKVSDKVEPKFKAGYWIVTSYGKVNQVIAVDEDGDGFTLDDDTYFSGSWKDMYHLWTIADAKDGDVLYSPCCKLLWIYKDEKTCHVGSKLNYNSGGIVINKPVCIPTDVQPATKEQRDTLMKAMADVGYTFDFEKKELNKIKQKPVELHREDEQNLNACFGYIPDEFLRRWLTDIIHVKYDKPAWSEEDEELLGWTINNLTEIEQRFGKDYGKVEKCINWIKQKRWKKSLKTADLENSLCDIQDGYSDTSYEYRVLGEAIEFIRSTDNPHAWRPSDEQMLAISTAINVLGKGTLNEKQLIELQEQLKRLKRE